MANVFGTLSPEIVSAQAMTAIGNKTAWLLDFSTDFSGEIRRKSVLDVPVYTGGTTLTDATNFAQADSTSTTVQVTPVHLYQPISLTFGEYNYFHKLETQIGAAVNTLVDKMQSLVFASLSTDNFSVGLSAASTGITSANLGTAWASLEGNLPKVCYLNSTAYSKFLPTTLESFDPAGMPAYGFQRLGYADTFTTAQNGVYGFVANKAAFAIAAGLPEINVDGVDQMVIQLGNGLEAKLTSFTDPNTRTTYMGVESMFGVSIAQSAGLKLIKW